MIVTCETNNPLKWWHVASYAYTPWSFWPPILKFWHFVKLTMERCNFVMTWGIVRWWHMEFSFSGLMPRVNTFWLSHWLIVNLTMGWIDLLGANQFTPCSGWRGHLNMSFWMIVKLTLCQIWLINDAIISLVKKTI